MFDRQPPCVPCRFAACQRKRQDVVAPVRSRERQTDNRLPAHRRLDIELHPNPRHVIGVGAIPHFDRLQIERPHRHRFRETVDARVAVLLDFHGFERVIDRVPFRCREREDRDIAPIRIGVPELRGNLRQRERVARGKIRAGHLDVTLAVIEADPRPPRL